MTRATPLQIEATGMTVAMALGKKAARRNPNANRIYHAEPMPADFRETMLVDTVKELIQRYGVGKHVIARWKKECGLVVTMRRYTEKHAGGRPVRGMPDDFRERFFELTREALMQHYGAGQKMVVRWVKEAGVGRRNAAPVRRVRESLPIKPRPKLGRALAAPRLVSHHKATISEIRRDTSAAGKAQEILQRDKWAVYRCDESGRQDVTGKLWRCGRVIVTDAELIERAGRVTARMGRVAA